MTGVLNLKKEAGWTSHDAVAKARRLLSERRIGHAGTLDPDATGVLVIAVGQATRLLPHLPTEPKEYVAEIGFGIATETEDASGATVAEADAHTLTENQLRAALPAFVGEIQQVPPMYSALHYNGQRLYELARQGITVERAPRTVMIHALELLSFTPGTRATASIRVVCGGGTYIRTLCVDIGQAVGLPAHMATLERTAVGIFRIEKSVTLADLTPVALLPLTEAIDLPKIPIGDAEACAIQQGRAIPAVAPVTGEVALLFQKRLLALARLQNGQYHPFKVLAE